MINAMICLASMGGPAVGGDAGGAMGFVFPIVIFMGIFYFMMIRPQMRREKERKALLEGVKSGEKVLFSGGIIGIVTNVKDDTLMIKVADNVKIEVARGAVIKILEKGEKAVVEESK
jgi:preprotein translocase subunit YajC